MSAAVNGWKKAYIEAMVKEVYVAHVTAQAEALRAIDANIEWMVINDAAKLYAREYGQMLTDEGASIIGGERVPWLRDMTEQRRTEVMEIIERGLNEGLPTGVRETGKGTYPKGSISRELQDYFGDRKSHASTVARTELGRIQNVSKLDRWKDRGWEVVRVQDGDGANPCEACKLVDGQVWTVDYARMNELEHPNCVRNFIPLRPEDYEGETVIGV